jgi:hypothetical protein
MLILHPDTTRRPFDHLSKAGVFQKALPQLQAKGEPLRIYGCKYEQTPESDSCLLQ